MTSEAIASAAETLVREAMKQGLKRRPPKRRSTMMLEVNGLEGFGYDAGEWVIHVVPMPLRRTAKARPSDVREGNSG